MRDEIISYIEMCTRERMSLQRGMNFRASPGVSVVLMSRRPSAPYVDSLSEDGTVLTYEGHDVTKLQSKTPKAVDQPWTTPSGSPTENGKFAAACDASEPALVRVYEKLRDGIWSDRGLFELRDFQYMSDGSRKVFRFSMVISDEPDEPTATISVGTEFRRVIPSWVKQEVFRRDKGRCVDCGAQDELHFDHDLPFSRGGTGLTPENVKILCARHNLQKGAKIQ
jgi:hypothetical protein